MFRKTNKKRHQPRYHVTNFDTFCFARTKTSKNNRVSGSTEQIVFFASYFLDTLDETLTKIPVKNFMRLCAARINTVFQEEAGIRKKMQELGKGFKLFCIGML